MKQSYLALILMIVLRMPTYGHRENSYYLHGNVMGKRLAMELEEYGDNCTARYILEDDPYDHFLEGSIQDTGVFILYSYNWDQATNKRNKVDSIFLEEYDLNMWKGTWKSREGNTDSFYLSPIIIDSLNHPYVKTIKRYSLSPFVAYRTKDVDFKTVKKRKIARGFAIEYVSDRNSEVEWFRVVPNEKNGLFPDSLNSRLEAEHLLAVNIKYSSTYLDIRSEYRLSFNVHFLNSNLLSYTRSSTETLPGSKAREIHTCHTINVRSTEPIPLEDLIWFGDQPRPELNEGEYNWFQYRYNVFAPAILELLSESHAKAKSSGGSECYWMKENTWQFPSWYLTPKGVHFIGKTPTLDTKCLENPEATISFSTLKEYIIKESGLGDYSMKNSKVN